MDFPLYLRMFPEIFRKPCQLWASISLQRIKIFEFCKKHLNPHMQGIKICDNEKKLKFEGRPPTPYRLKVAKCTPPKHYFSWENMTKNKNLTSDPLFYFLYNSIISCFKELGGLWNNFVMSLLVMVRGRGGGRHEMFSRSVGENK